MASGPGQETTQIEERHRFDEASLERYLTRELPGFPGITAVRKFGFGQSNPTFCIECHGKKYVLRKKPPGKLIKGAHAVDREYRVMKVLGLVGFEVPKMHVLCEDESVLGTPFYLMDFVEGRIVDNGLLKLPLEQRKPAMLAIVKTLAKLHSYDPVALGLVNEKDAFGRVGGFYSRQISTMAKTSEMQASKVEPLRSMKSLLKTFEANMPEDRSCVVHGDWKPDNVILSAGSHPFVLAVLDWELSTLGHPMSDLANMCLPYHLGPLGTIVSYPAFGDGCFTEEEVHRAYCDASGISFPINSWSFFIAFSCFRLAVIAQGVAMRASQGMASNADSGQASQIASVANALCDKALEIMTDPNGMKAKL